MHDCDATEENLVDLLFNEAADEQRRRLLADVELCEFCGKQYRSMLQTLHAFDFAAEAALPGDDFWPDYEERLRTRMAQEIQPNVWQQAAASIPFMRGEYHLTILEETGLTTRLAAELRSVAHDAELTWPELRKDPVGFARRGASAYGRAGYRFFSQRNVALATLSSFLVISLLLGGLYALERVRAKNAEQVAAAEEYELLGMVPDEEIPKEQEKPQEEGPAGFNKGKGQGSKPKYEKAAGGGGGGRQEQAPASFGKPPQFSMEPQIVTPNPKPPKAPSLPMPSTLKGDPMLNDPNPPPLPDGLRESKSMTPSSGPGTGGGMGTGSGGGAGQGEGGGYGPGRGGNIGGGDMNIGGGGAGGGGGGAPAVDYSRPFRPSEVTRKAVITSKPDPGFTEEARKNNVTGAVRLKAILSASGAVTNISVIKGLPDGLTERAIAAARSIKFQPAQKDGRAVSQYVTLEYNFNIY